MKNYLSKSEIASLLGLTKSQVRFYEKKGLLEPLRDKNGYGMYGFKELDTLDIILVLKGLNLSINEIKAILEESEVYDYEQFLEKSFSQIDDEIRHLIQKRDNIKQRLEVYKKHKLNEYQCQVFLPRQIYEIDLADLETIIDVYNLVMNTGEHYSDYDSELYILYYDHEEKAGIYSISNKTYNSGHLLRHIEGGTYISYTMSEGESMDFDLQKKRFLSQVEAKGYTIDGPLIYIDHFGKRVYTRHHGIYTLQVKIKDDNHEETHVCNSLISST